MLSRVRLLHTGVFLQSLTYCRSKGLIEMPPKTSGKAAAKSGKATKAVTKGDKKKRKGKRKESYAIYIYKVCEF